VHVVAGVWLGLAEDPRDLGSADWADALGEPTPVLLLNVTVEGTLFLALHAVRLTAIRLGHCCLRSSANRGHDPRWHCRTTAAPDRRHAPTKRGRCPRKTVQNRTNGPVPPTLRSALVDADRLRADLDALLRFASIGGTPAEAAVQTWVAERFAADGLDVEVRTEAIRATDPQFPGMEVPRESITTVLGRRVGSQPGPTIVLCGHTDVVPPGVGWTHPPFEPTWQEGPRGARVFARGACDMKAGLVAAWAAVRELRDVDLRGEIVLLPVSAEEDGGAGTFHALRSGVHADMCIIPEPTDLALVPANAGALTFRLTVPGAAVHASRRTEGMSAVDKFWPIVEALRALEAKRNTDVDSLMERWSLAYPLSIGHVQAGNWASSVPDVLIAEGRYGVALGESVDAAKTEFETCIAHACLGDPWLRDHPVQVDWWGGQFAPGNTPIDDPLISALGAAHRNVLGDDADIYGAPYGSDLRLWRNLAGVPTVQYGPGDSAVAHGPDEYVDFVDVITCAHVLTEFLRRACT